MEIKKLTRTKLTSSKLSTIAKNNRAISLDELVEISALAEKAGGELVNFEPEDDNWCGSCGLKIPIGKKDQMNDLFGKLVLKGIGFEVLINGIVAPEEIYMQLHRSRLGRRYIR